MPSLQLKSSHLVIPPDISGRIFPGGHFVYAAFKAKSGELLVSNHANSWFPKLHQASEIMIKIRDLKGTKSIALHEILLDYGIDEQDRTLSCQINENKQFLKIALCPKSESTNP